MVSRWPVVLALGGLVGWIALAVTTWCGGAVLGHDEAQYAIAAQDLLRGESPRWWFYLSRGMELVGAPGVLLGEGERAMRAVPLVIGAFAFPFALWRVARVTFGTTSGNVITGAALLVLAGASGVTRIAIDLNSDLPAATALLGAVALFVGEVDRQEGPAWKLVLAAPLLAAAVYLRYGSVVPIAVIVVAALALGAKTVVRCPWPVLATAALFLAMLVPHFISAVHYTGSPLGILLAGRGIPEQAYVGDGLVSYITSNPLRLYGYLIPFVMLAGLASARIGDRRRLLVWIIALGTLVAIGLITHAQPRYVLLSVSLFTLLGVDQLQRWHRRTLLVVGLAGAIVCVLVFRWRLGVPHERAERVRGTLNAARAIRADAKGARCTVIGAHYTQLEWYSGCRAPLILDRFSAEHALARGEHVYVVRDYLPSRKPLPQPDLYEQPGRTHVLLVRPLEVEVVKLTPLGV